MTTQAPTRLLTKRELWTIAIVLSTAIARDSDKLIRAEEHNLFAIYDRLRNAGESLYAITDYALRARQALSSRFRGHRASSALYPKREVILLRLLNNWEHAERPASPAQTPPQTPAA